MLDVTILVAVHLLREGKAFRGTGHHACSFEDVYAAGHRGDAGRCRGRYLAGRDAEDDSCWAARCGRQREYASRRTGDRQQRLHPSARSCGDQSGAGRSARNRRRRSILPVALGVLAGSGQLSAEKLEHYAIIGELALEGMTRPVKGVLSIAIEAAKNDQLRGLVVPAENAGEAAVVEGLEVIAVESLAQAVAFFADEIELHPAPSRLEQLFEQFSVYDIDFGDVRGQESAKRAMTLAAAGRHNLIMVGPPGSGKTMLAKRMPTILPQLSAPESIETTRIYSALGQLPAGQPLLGASSLPQSASHDQRRRFGRRWQSTFARRDQQST